MSEERCEKCTYFRPYAFAPNRGACLSEKTDRYETRSIDTCEHLEIEEGGKIMSKTNIDWENQDKRPIATMGGSKVEIIGERYGHLIGIVHGEKGITPCAWFLDGAHWFGCGPNLIQAPERLEYKAYVNVYCTEEKAVSLRAKESKNEAQSVAYDNAIATAIPTTVTIENGKIVIHGEGEINEGVEV